jgi:hypothetical protein
VNVGDDSVGGSKKGPLEDREAGALELERHQLLLVLLGQELAFGDFEVGLGALDFFDGGLAAADKLVELFYAAEIHRPLGFGRLKAAAG